MAPSVAVVGATGAVGEIMRQVLDEHAFPFRAIKFLASERSAGKTLTFKGKTYPVEPLRPEAFAGIDVVLSSTPASVSREYSPIAARAGAVVIDNSSAWRMDPEVPLVVPEVNADKLRTIPKGIVANPNCSTIQMVVALKPLHQLGTIKRVVVSTYQSVSGAGKEGMDELFEQTRGVYVNDQREPQKFPKPIAFNLIPQIDVFMDDGSTKEEWKMVVETKKILDPKIKVNATCVRVPVFVGHSESVNVEFEKSVSVEQARAALAKAPGVLVIDRHEPGGYMTPIECVGEDATYVSRIRQDPTIDNGLSFWCVSDNLRKGAALNAVQIAEVLIRDYLKK